MHTLLTMDTHDPVFWVAIAFLVFVGLLIYYGVPKLVGNALDQRAEAIRQELDNARKLREDAQALLADYQKKSRDAEIEARSIIEQAKVEAETLAAESRRTLAENMERRSKLAEEKIARAEAQAISEVRASAVNTALAAAEKVLQTKSKGNVSDSLIEQSIKDLRGKLN